MLVRSMQMPQCPEHNAFNNRTVLLKGVFPNSNLEAIVSMFASTSLV